MNGIRAFLYYPLAWIKEPFLLFSRFLGTLAFLGAILLLIAGFFGGHLKGELPNWAASVLLAAGSFLLFFLHNHYDQILVSVKPHGTKPRHN